MKTWNRLLFVTVFSLWAIVACAPEPSETVESAKPRPYSAEELWQEDMADYQTWAMMPGSTEKMETTGRHGELATVRVNSIAAAAIAADAEAIPEGGVVIKENFDADGTRTDIVAMRKLAAGWYWAEYETTGARRVAGPALSECLQCHSMSGNDNLFTWVKGTGGDSQ